MKLLKASNVFESYKFCSLLSKICCFYFATIEKDKNGLYVSKTTYRDIILYVGYLSLGFYWMQDLLSQPTIILSSRSIILELALDLKCKMQYFQPFITLTVAFYYRHSIVKILGKINKVDMIVSTFIQLKFDSY